MFYMGQSRAWGLLCSTGRSCLWRKSRNTHTQTHQDLTTAIPDWPDLQFGGEDIKTRLSHMTNCLLKQCAHVLKWTLNNQWSFGHRLYSYRDVHSQSMHSTASGGGWFRTWNTSQWTEVFSGLECNDSTMSGGACTHDSLLKNNHSTMSGGGCHFIGHRLESPKHRVSRGLHIHNLNGLLCVT